MIKWDETLQATSIIQALITIVSTTFLTLIGISKLFKKSKIMSKYLIHTKREQKIGDTTDVFEITHDEQIKSLIDEKEDLNQKLESLKNENSILRKKYNEMGWIVLWILIVMSFSYIWDRITCKRKRIEKTHQ